ncbi:nuclear receptor subfamily 1 group D member 1 [Aplysia californica]|uniref:Nuclear receptor subfamily 1 group D member 1 n=1 Tax=Aplysia californica TaxID=6500 RepID=A0ABM1A330_APLCA|nr:nuclear receptor subfamily 1 group D member 1 [Aplysia californica]
MTHKCANEEKCEITPFTRNSCQYCRLKKCFEVGMSREASRLGRRPKRLKEVSGEQTRTHTTNLPIAPYPSPQELYRLRMAELQKLLQANGTFKSELMQAFLSAAQQSFREHSKSGGGSSSSHSSHHHNVSAPSSSITSGGGGGITAPVSTPSLPQDVNLNPDPSMLGSKSFGMGLDLPNVGSPSSMQAPSPFPDLSMADFSPLTPGGTNLNTSDIFDNKMFIGQGANMNGNTVFSPSTQPLNDNMPSPLNMPPLDNLDPCSPSTFMAFNTNQMASPDSSSSANKEPAVNNNLNNNAGTSTSMYGLGGAAPDNMSRLNINTNLMSPMSPLLSPTAIKQEVDSNIANANILIKEEPIEEGLELINTPENMAEVKRIMGEVREPPSTDRLLLIDQVTDAIIDAHMATTVGTRAKVNEAFDRISTDKGCPDMPDISSLTVSVSLIWQKFLSSMVPEISKVVKFGKKLPGFVEVGQEDQIRLIKQGSFEVMLVRHSILVDPINETMLDPSLSVASPRQVIKSLPMGQFLDEFFMIARHIHPLNLSDGELAMLGAILLICPGRNNLTNVLAIRTIQQLYQQALFRLMKHTHKDYEERFQNLMSLVPLFQKVNSDHSKFLNSIKMKSPAEFDQQFPALHKEVFQDC